MGVYNGHYGTREGVVFLTLRQATVCVNRIYKNETQKMEKPHDLVLDFVGIFDKLEEFLAFDSNYLNEPFVRVAGQ